MEYHSQLNEIVVEYFRNGCGHIKQLQLSAIVGQHAELLHEQLGLREARLIEVVDEVLRQSA